MTDDLTPPVEPAGQGGSWTDSFGDDARGYIENKGWKEPGDLLNSYQNLEKLRGVPENQLLRLPDDPKADGAFDPIYDRLGRPESPDKYTNVVGEALGEETFGEITKTAHMLGLSDGQLQGMQQVMGDLSTKMAEAQEAQSAAAFDQWKSANPDGFADAARVMAAVGMDEAGVEALLSGDKTALYDFAAKIGAKTAEQPVVQGDGGKPFAMSKQAAQAKINEMMANKEFTDRYFSDNPRIRQPAIEEMSRLQEAASQG